MNQDFTYSEQLMRDCECYELVCVVSDSKVVEGCIYFGDFTATAAFYQDKSFEMLFLFRNIQIPVGIPAICRDWYTTLFTSSVLGGHPANSPTNTTDAVARGKSILASSHKLCTGPVINISTWQSTVVKPVEQRQEIFGDDQQTQFCISMYCPDCRWMQAAGALAWSHIEIAWFDYS